MADPLGTDSQQRTGRGPHQRLETPWVIEWHDQHLTVLLARDAVWARSKAELRQKCKDDGWRGLETARVYRVRPVDALELNVAPRAELNRPEFGYIRVHRKLIPWAGPHDGVMQPLGQEADVGILTGTPLGIRVASMQIWSYVWSHRKLALLTAKDFDAACHRAASSFRASKRGAVEDLVEPITRFELQLAKGPTGHAPTCFRLWIDGYKVGWPPTEDQEPRWSDPSPGTPLGAEARLPIPQYAHTYAYGPGPRRQLDRRFGTPWWPDPESVS